METFVLILSLLLFFIFGSYLFFGSYVVLINSKEKSNRVFLVLCLFLSVGVFGFALSLFTVEMDVSFFWRRVSGLGWVTFPGILLHFFLILTDKKEVLKKWWLYLLLYIPAGIFIYVFSLSHDLAMMQYQFIKTSFGWISIPVNNQWLYLDLLYSYGYIFISMGLIRQQMKSRVPEIQKSAAVIFYGFIVSLVIGCLLDLISRLILSTNSLQTVPNIMFVAMLSIFYGIRKYRLVRTPPVNKDEIILSEATRTQIYNYLSVCFAAGSILNLISQYFLEEKGELFSVLMFSGMLLLIGFLIQVIQRSRRLKPYQNNLILMLVVLAIPLVTFEFIRVAGQTVWAFPFILIIIFLVFNNRIALVGISISIFLTQIFVFLSMPQVIVEIDSDDHVVRMGLFGIAIWVAFFVNQLYVLRLKQIAQQMKIQKLISDFSSDFVNVSAANFDEKIRKWLRVIGGMFEISRSCVCFFNEDKTKLSCSQEWCNAGVKSHKEEHQNYQVEKAPVWVNSVLEKKIVHYLELGEQQKEDHETSQDGSLYNHVQVSIPISCKGEVSGFLSLKIRTKDKKLNRDYQNLFEIVENILADAMMKIEAEKETNHRAYYDLLTELPNRLMFNQKLQGEIPLAVQTEKMIGVIFLDIDNFKTINDTMGHHGGDKLLVQFSQKLLKAVKKTDIVSRFAGDEFLIMVRNINREKEVVRVVERIMDLFNSPFYVNGQEFYLSASLGIAIYPTDGKKAEVLIKNADMAMFKAKEKGKNRYFFCSQNLRDEVANKNRLTNNLYHVLENKELFLLYQPQISLKTGKIIAVEALVRWQHPELGLIPPKVMIPLAEQTGLINPIGEWVLKTACLQNKSWQDQGLPPVRMAVNMSATQFRNPKLNGQIMRILKETDLKPRYLELELTENIAINKSDYIVGVLGSIKKLGVFISIDDFGTEYSSLSRLKMLPIDQLKMDKQFVDGLAENEKDQAIADTIILLAQNLGLHVIAEGVETEEQINFLREHDCDSVQGFYYYEPMAAKKIEKLLKNN